MQISGVQFPAFIYRTLSSKVCGLIQEFKDVRSSITSHGSIYKDSLPVTIIIACCSHLGHGSCSVRLGSCCGDWRETGSWLVSHMLLWTRCMNAVRRGGYRGKQNNAQYKKYCWQRGCREIAR